MTNNPVCAGRSSCPDVRTNSPRAWLLASRPQTLTGAIAPVLVGASFAIRHLMASGLSLNSQLSTLNSQLSTVNSQLSTVNCLLILCLLFAVFMQIDANLINDYFDFRKGTDRADRLGPERACAQGWITPKALRWGIAVMTILSCLVGLAILYMIPFSILHFSLLLAVGLLCIVFCFLYTTHLSYRGWGDLLVLIFFGLIPVLFTYYVMTIGLDLNSQLSTVNSQLSTLNFHLPLLLASIAMGLATDNLLMVNNYRDRHQDLLSGKRTIIVRIIEAQKRKLGDEQGQKEGEQICLDIYLWLGIFAVLLALTALFLHPLSTIRYPLLLIYLILHFKTFQQLKTLDGRDLNRVLGQTARNIFLFGLLLAISVFL